ncbi:hypothetical protein AWC05_14060 [Mycobacterium florentinum]|uniref:Uncharacterized protein n=1 Tax=Mycobacterium florentinum TaxID=292462 RepID=A0A1X1UDU3_MYCFL|nr:hypothetical protein [Mycobacterium florentinum]MCV7412025.1 hypothetical protein [Mycobacterium florentinum]ORV54995.1 hypothetical protein AWC05_14060 [Mycobacterium florentinum]BBX81393.1 hypothetical protein MFLOJ_51800 [Mycobacterium florentinum]
MPGTPAQTKGASVFTGRPSWQARIGAPTLQLLRSIVGLVGIDLGASINALIASRHPPRHTTTRALAVLGPDTVALQAKSRATPGAKFTFDLRDGEIHCWAMASWLPEARAVRSQIYHQLLGS